MNGNLSGFDAETVKAMDGGLLPIGDYKVAITEAPLRETKAGNGTYLALAMQILDGPMQNRRLWDNISLKNPNELAVQIGEARLAEICKSVGILKPADSSELCHKPLMARVGQKERKDTGQLQNVVHRYSAYNPDADASIVDKAPW